MSNQISRFQYCLTLRRVSGQNVEVSDRNTSLTLGPAYMDRRSECGHRDVHIRRIRGNAVFARAENGQTPVGSGDRGATRPRLTFVAWHRGVAEIHTPGPLEEIASGRRHVSKLNRRATENCFGKNGVVLTDERVVREIRVANYSPDR